MADLLLYGSIDSFGAAEFISELDEKTANNEDLLVRVNTPGGNPEYAFGMVAKYKEYTGKKRVQVDGKAFSAGLFFLCYADEVEAYDVSEFLLHRAAYPEYFENDPKYFTDAIRGNLDRVNASLMTAFKNKVDVPLFEELTGFKLKDVFSMERREDVFFSADVAKKIGLISKVNKITPTKKAEIKEFESLVVMEMAAEYKGAQQEEIKTDKMTLEELKAKHPDVYAQAHKEGMTSGINKEKDRVEACMVFLDIDPVGVKAAIESGNELTAKAMAEFALKANSKTALATLETETKEQPVVDTKEVPNTEKAAEAKTVEDFMAEVKKHSLS